MIYYFAILISFKIICTNCTKPRTLHKKIDMYKLHKFRTFCTYIKIEINFTNVNTSLQKGKLVFKLTVAESIEVETWTEYLELDISSLDQEYQDADFYVGLSDLDHVSGMTSESYQMFRNIKAENGKLKITMEYAVAHRYQISVGVINKETGYNQYKSKKLTFIQNGYALTISVI